MPKSVLTLDEVDHELLDLLQHDSARTLRELGDLVALSPSAVQRRIDRYRKHGVIARQVALLDPSRLPTVLLAVCLVMLEGESNRHHHAFRKRLLAASEVEQVYDVSGDWDYVVIVACGGMAHHTKVANRLFNEAPNVRRLHHPVRSRPGAHQRRTTHTCPAHLNRRPCHRSGGVARMTAAAPRRSRPRSAR